MAATHSNHFRLFSAIYLQAFSILFVCIAITSDLVCLFFIPVSWLFFLASTYVWVQYVWHAGEWMLPASKSESKSSRVQNLIYTFFSDVDFDEFADKGFCLPTIFLWMLFLYLEGAVRWRDDSKNIPHVDLCRPFAAHWYVCGPSPLCDWPSAFTKYILLYRSLQHWLSGRDIRIRCEKLCGLPNKASETTRSVQRKWILYAIIAFGTAQRWSKSRWIDLTDATDARIIAFG